jgi:hypothetical protein
MKGVVALVLILGLIYGAWRAIVHGSNVPPAIVTPATNVHMEFSGNLVARLYRVTHDV